MSYSKLLQHFLRQNSAPNVRQMIAFIDAYRDRFSVEFICKTLNQVSVGGFITSRGYRDAKSRDLSARAKRDLELVGKIKEVHAENFLVY